MAVPIGEYKQAVEALAQRMKAFYEKACIDIEKEWEKNYIPGSKFANEIEALAEETNQEIDDKFIERFCHKSVMTLMLKFLFLRFAEDKKILEPYFRNETIGKWQAENKEAQEVIKEAFEKAKEKFRGLYKITVYDEFLPTKESLETYLIDALSNEPRSGPYKDKGALDFATLDPTVVSAFYEKLFERKKRKELGLFFTPPVIAEYLVEKAFEGQKITKDFLVLDPACGSGQILLAAYRRLKDVFISQLGMNSGEAHKQILSHNLWGVDIEPFAVLLSRINLAIQDLENVPEYINIIHGDSLLETGFDIPQMAMLKDVGEKQKQKLIKETIQTQGGKEITFWRNGSGRILLEKPIEQKQLFELVERMKTGIFSESGIRTMKDLPKEFDAVVANPPYVRQEKIKKYKPQLKEKFESYSGTVDLYVYFIEKGIALIKPGGKLCYITSNKFIKSAYGSEIRKYILNHCIIERVFDFSRIKIFEDATNDPVIFTLMKTLNIDDQRNKKIQVCYVTNINSYEDINISIKNKKFYVSQDILDHRPWVLQPKEILTLKSKIEETSTPLKIYCGEPLSGIKTGASEILIVSKQKKEEIIDNNKSEEELYVPIIIGEEILKWRYCKPKRYLIFAEGRDINDFPNTKKYLDKYRKILSERSDIKNTGKKWLELRPCAYYGQLKKPKIIFPDIASGPRFTFDGEGVFINNTAYAIPKIDLYLLSLLNSKLVNFVFKLSNIKLGDKGFRYIYEYTQDIPIYPATSDQQKPFIELANKMLELNEKLQEAEKTFYGFVEGKIENEMLLREIEGLDFVNIKDSQAKLGEKSKISAIQEEESLIVSINKKPTIKIICDDKVFAEFLSKYLDGLRTYVLSGKDGDSWIERILNTKIHWDKKSNLEKLLNNYKSLQTSAEKIKQEVTETDKKIDEMVYNLYGITEEERKVIEEDIR